MPNNQSTKTMAFGGLKFFFSSSDANAWNNTVNVIIKQINNRYFLGESKR